MPTQSQVRQNLCIVNGQQAIYRLYLENHLTGDNDIQSIPTV